jgi:predicted nucleic acid-binding protein
MKVFYDTNVLLDVVTKRQPHYEDSARVWSLADAAKVDGFVSAITYPNAYYILRKMLDAKEADRVLRVIRGAFRTVAFDEQILSQAMDANMPDFEDAIQFFSAVHCGANYILTRDAGDFPGSGIPVMTPAEFLSVYLEP